MDWLKEPDSSVGPTASAYMFPLVSVSEVTVAAVSFHPTMTTFRSPAVCAPVYTAATCDADVGNAAFTWTKVCAGAVGESKTVSKKMPMKATASVKSLEAFITGFPFGENLVEGTLRFSEISPYLARCLPSTARPPRNIDRVSCFLAITSMELSRTELSQGARGKERRVR